MTNASANAQFDNPGDELVDVLPPELTLVAATVLSGGGAVLATPGTNTVTWNGSIPGSGSVVIEIEATINGGTIGETISNQAEIFYDADGEGSNEAMAFTDDPAVAGGQDPTDFNVGTVVDIPTLTPAGLAALILLLAAAALLKLLRRRAVS